MNVWRCLPCAHEIQTQNSLFYISTPPYTPRAQGKLCQTFGVTQQNFASCEHYATHCHACGVTLTTSVPIGANVDGVTVNKDKQIYRCEIA